jgi:hypothetical protein
MKAKESKLQNVKKSPLSISTIKKILQSNRLLNMKRSKIMLWTKKIKNCNLSANSFMINSNKTPTKLSMISMMRFLTWTKESSNSKNNCIFAIPNKCSSSRKKLTISFIWSTSKLIKLIWNKFMIKSIWSYFWWKFFRLSTINWPARMFKPLSSSKNSENHNRFQELLKESRNLKMNLHITSKKTVTLRT